MNATLGLLAHTSLFLYIHTFIIETRWTMGLLHFIQYSVWQCIDCCLTWKCMHSYTYQQYLQSSHCQNVSSHTYLNYLI